MLEFNQCIKSDKMLCLICGNTQFFIWKIDSCKNDLGKFSAIKVGKYVPCG